MKKLTMTENRNIILLGVEKAASFSYASLNRDMQFPFVLPPNPSLRVSNKNKDAKGFNINRRTSHDK